VSKRRTIRSHAGVATHAVVVFVVEGGEIDASVVVVVVVIGVCVGMSVDSQTFQRIGGIYKVGILVVVILTSVSKHVVVVVVRCLWTKSTVSRVMFSGWALGRVL
jgi:hypothetical protein